MILFVPLILVAAAVAQPIPPTVRLVGPSEVGVATPFIVNVQVEDARGVAGWEGDIVWDPTALQLINATEGDYISTPYDASMLLDIQDGTMAIGQWSVKARTGILGRAEFVGVGEGPTTIDLHNIILVDIEAEVYPGATVVGMNLQIGPTPTPTNTATPTPTPTSTPTPVCLCTYWDGSQVECTP